MNWGFLLLYSMPIDIETSYIHNVTRLIGYEFIYYIGKLVAELHDKEYQENYVLKENQRGLSISVDDVMFITDTLFLTSDDDYIMRVWDINSGNRIYTYIVKFI